MRPDGSTDDADIPDDIAPHWTVTSIQVDP